jgi:DNA repair protein RadC
MSEARKIPGLAAVPLPHQESGEWVIGKAKLGVPPERAAVIVSGTTRNARGSFAMLAHCVAKQSAIPPCPDPSARQGIGKTDNPMDNQLNEVRERMENYGPLSVSDRDLLNMLLPTATVAIQSLLEEVQNDLFRLGRFTCSDLQTKGFTKVQATTLVACMELGRRRRSCEPVERPSITSSASAYELIRGKLCDLPHEEFWILLLDRGNRLIRMMQTSKGGMHGTVADPKVIFKDALNERASAMILCHNHPSGQLRPSDEDIRLTRKLTEGGRLLDIGVHDHLILSGSGYYSFADNGML